MNRSSELLLETDRPAVLASVREALSAAGIPHDTGLLAHARPTVAVFVPAARLAEAREIVRDIGDDEEGAALAPAPDSRFPRLAIEAAAALTLVHLALVGMSVTERMPRAIARFGIDEQTLVAEPWRLATAMVLHVDVRHVLWNALSMLVFLVPLAAWVGLARAAAVYAAAGLGGGVAAAWFLAPGAVVLGSSGAVAGLFGGWTALAWHRARTTMLPWHARVRSVGIALLVLPSVLSPTTAEGRPVSVASHLGGLATGVLIGALFSRRWIATRAVASPPESS